MAHWIDNAPALPTPTYLIDEHALQANMVVLDRIRQATQCHILLALKGYATWGTFPLIRPYLNGVTASSLYEARLGIEEFKKDVHVYCVAMAPSECAIYNDMAHHITFNSMAQYHQFLTMVPSVKPALGLRINPMVGAAPVEKYDPCTKQSRLGVPITAVDHHIMTTMDGLHFHALCEQGIEPLIDVLNHIEGHLGPDLHRLNWMNWGGGHRLTDSDYDVDRLIHVIRDWQTKYGLRVILEPGEAIGRHCGYYVTTVRDIVGDDPLTAICDISITAHMPDVLEYPYRPDIWGADQGGEWSCLIGGNTCLAGDVVGPYQFDRPLSVGDRLVFLDMGHYTIVKTSNFNGVNQPAIGVISSDGGIRILSQSCYSNFKNRLS